MPEYVGVDWAGNGWLAVSVADGEWRVRRHPAFLSVHVHHPDADAVLVDVPIGLPETDVRACDNAARDVLPADRRASVFATPCRDAVHADTYAEAADANEDALGRGLSSQAWGLAPRIREVDDFLAAHPDARDTVRESHPEVCVTALNSDAALPSKHADGGLDARLAVLDEYAPARDVYEAALDRHVEDVPPWARRIGDGNRDDVVDALCLAVTARLGAGEYETLPERPPTDDRGLPMRIVYHAPGSNA